VPIRSFSPTSVTRADSDKSSQLVCLARRFPVMATPEELVRQEFLSHCFGPFGCSRHLVAVEMSLRRLCPHVHPGPPRRRLDIVCSYVNNERVDPLLLVECKASLPSSAALTQVLGYNFFVKAPFVALTWPGHILLATSGGVWYEGKLSSMPCYAELVVCQL
jgi:hypothetical protein